MKSTKQTKKQTRKPTLKSIIKKSLGVEDCIWDPKWYRTLHKNWRIMADLEEPRRRLK